MDVIIEKEFKNSASFNVMDNFIKSITKGHDVFLSGEVGVLIKDYGNKKIVSVKFYNKTIH
jgi:hypothetical protein